MLQTFLLSFRKLKASCLKTVKSRDRITVCNHITIKEQIFVILHIFSDLSIDGTGGWHVNHYILGGRISKTLCCRLDQKEQRSTKNVMFRTAASDCLYGDKDDDSDYF